MLLRITAGTSLADDCVLTKVDSFGEDDEWSVTDEFGNEYARLRGRDGEPALDDSDTAGLYTLMDERRFVLPGRLLPDGLLTARITLLLQVGWTPSNV